MSLAPRQILIAAALLVPIAMLTDGPSMHLTLRGAIMLAYATPSVGLLISALSLGEAVD